MPSDRALITGAFLILFAGGGALCWAIYGQQTATVAMLIIAGAFVVMLGLYGLLRIIEAMAQERD